MKKTFLFASLLGAALSAGAMVSGASAEVAAIFKMNTVGCAVREPLKTSAALNKIDDPIAIQQVLDEDIKKGVCKVFKGGDAVIILESDPKDRMDLVRLAGDNVPFWVHTATMTR